MDPSSSQQSFTSPSLEQDFIPQQSQLSLLESSDDEESPLFARNLNPRQRVNSDAPALAIEAAVEAAAIEYARELTPIDRNDAAGALALLSQQRQQESRRVSVGVATPAVPPAALAPPVAAPAASAPAPPAMAPAASATQDNRFGCLTGATVEDIELVADPIYHVTKGKTDMTRIKSIKGNAIQDVKANTIYLWCTHVGIRLPGRKQKNKLSACEAIILFKDTHDRLAANPQPARANAPAVVAAGTTNNTRTRANGRSRISYPRLANTLLKDDVRAAYVNRGGTMTREQLDRGETADLELWQLVADTYNDVGDEQLGMLHYSVDWGHQPDPSVFDLIDHAKARSNMATMASTYDKAYGRWDVSGRHQNIAFADFHEGSKWVLYLHQLLEQHPDLFSSVKVALPEYAFRESGRVSASVKKKRSRETAGKGAVDSDAMADMAVASQQRSDIMAYSVFSSAFQQTKEELATAKETRKSTKAQLKTRAGGNSKRAKAMVAFALEKMKAKEEGKEYHQDDFQEAFPFSQSSVDTYDSAYELAKEVVESDKAIEEAETRLKQQKQVMDSKMPK